MGTLRLVHSDLVIALVVVTALAFDFTNGFHDTANAMATSIATRALSPKMAVALAGALNFVGAFLSLKVAATIASDIVDGSAVTPTVIFAGLLGAIFWNLLTWRFGLPSSSSHALIGGVVGAVLIAKGSDAVLGDGLLSKVLIPAVIAPLLACLVAGIATFLVYRTLARAREDVAVKGYRMGQIASASLVALAHGTNDAQKTMGVITLALVANGTLSGENPDVPTWVIVSSATAIALGTYLGGWRIIKTLGSKVTEITPPQGFAAETTAAAVILASSHAGYPLSTTHVTSGGVVGSGVGKRFAGVDFGVIGQMVTAWILTIPAAAAAGALVYLVSDGLGDGTAAVLIISLIAAAASTALYISTQRGAGAIRAADV